MGQKHSASGSRVFRTQEALTKFCRCISVLSDHFGDGGDDFLIAFGGGDARKSRAKLPSAGGFT